MKKYIYIGQENGKEVVIDESGTKHNVEGIVPSYWKKGEEVIEATDFRIYLCGKSKEEGWYKVGMDYNGDNWGGIEVENKIYPIDKVVDCGKENCKRTDEYCYENCEWYKKEHIADTGKMIETEDELWNELLGKVTLVDRSFPLYWEQKVKSLSAQYTITRKTKPHE